MNLPVIWSWKRTSLCDLIQMGQWKDQLKVHLRTFLLS